MVNLSQSGVAIDGTTIVLNAGGELSVDGEQITHINPWNYKTLVSGTWQFQQGISSSIPFRVGENANAQNSEIEFPGVYLTAGDYKLIGRMEIGSANAIITFSFNGTEKTTLDTYNGSLLTNQRIVSASFNLATSGLYSIHAKAGTKNGSSSSYGHCWNNTMQIVRQI